MGISATQERYVNFNTDSAFNKKELHRVVQLNKNDLEAVGIDYKSIEPTLDGYYEVFKALRAANASSDYYPLNCVMSESYDLQPWFASLGLQNGVVVDEDLHVLDEKGYPISGLYAGGADASQFFMTEYNHHFGGSCSAFSYFCGWYAAEVASKSLQ